MAYVADHLSVAALEERYEACRSACGRSRTAIIGSNGSMSRRSFPRPPANAFGTSRTAYRSRSSRRSCASSRKKPAQRSLKEKLIKIGAKVVGHGRYVAFQMAEVAISRNPFADILRLIGELRPPPVTSTG